MNGVRRNGERGAERGDGVHASDAPGGVQGAPPTWELEQRLGRLLATGVIISATLFAVGLAIEIVAGGTLSTWLLHAGLVVLMATPFARVVVSVVEYVRERDWFFAAATLAVLAVLIATLVVAVRTAWAG